MAGSIKYNLKTQSGKRLFAGILTVIMSFNGGLHLMAQDLHYSQFYAAPLLINPANTGMSGEDLRIANIYRNQWARIGVPFQTFSTSVDKKLTLAGNTIGVGGFILHDQSSSFNLAANQFMLSLSYSRIVENQQLTVGIQSGLVYKSFNIDEITFNSQFNLASQLFDVTLPSLETGLDDRLKYFDMNIGISWRTMIHNLITSAGFSVSHLNTPVQKFSTSSTGIVLPVKMNFSSEVIVPLNNLIALKPTLFYSFTPGAHEFLLGSGGDYALSRPALAVKKLYAVSLLRINPVRDIDAIVLGGGMSFTKFNLGITYDFNISPLHRATNFNGAFEISFIYTGKKEDQQKNGQPPCYIMY